MTGDPGISPNPERDPVMISLQGIVLDAVLPAVCLHCSDCRRPHIRSLPIGEEAPVRVSVLSLWLYATGSPVRTLHRALKYGGRTDIGLLAGREMGRWARRRLAYVDRRTIVMPVPSHPVRIAERGYNHAEILARGVCEELRLACRPDGLDRIRLSVSQSGVPRGERTANVRGAFAPGNAGLLSGRPVLIVDDVFTTGSTVREASTIVREAGAAFVAALTMAIRIVR